MAKSTKVQSTKVRNLVVSIPCIFCKFPSTLFAYIIFIPYLCKCIVFARALCRTSWVEKDIVSDSEVIRKFEGPYQ